MGNAPTWAAEQPAPGDVVLYYRHLPLHHAAPYHWYSFDPPASVETLYGETIEARWAAVCGLCFCTLPLEEVPITGHVIWSRHERVIERVTIH